MFSFSACSTKTQKSKDNEEHKYVVKDESVTDVAEKQDAETVYREFLDKISFIKDDASWYDGVAATLNLCEPDTISGKLYCEWYVDYVQGGTEEEFFAMSKFERFVLTNTYTRLADAVGGSGHYNRYFGSKEGFDANITNQVLQLLTGNNKEVVKEAFRELLDWQYDYVTKNGVPFNFVNNRSYLEEGNKAPNIEEPSTLTEEEELEQIQEQIKKEISKKNKN